MPGHPEQTARLSPDGVLRVARLARLALTDEQADRYAAQLSRVLEYVEQLRALDLDGATPLLHPHDQTATPAADQPAPGLDPEAVRRLAPRAADTDAVFIRVPKVLPDGSGA